MTENVLERTRAKHIEMRYHFVRDAWQAGTILLEYEPTETMVADVLTKALPKEKHWLHTEAMGVKRYEGD